MAMTCQHAPDFLQFADFLIEKITTRQCAAYHIPTVQLHNYACRFIRNANTNSYIFKRSMRDLMRTKGYKIAFGLGVTITRIPVVNVQKDQWPALIENICNRLVDLHASLVGNELRLTPAKFRNVATIWPNADEDFNRACIDAMAKRNFTLKFTTVCVTVVPVRADAPVQPRVRVLKGRNMLDLLLTTCNKNAWKRGYTHAVTIDIKARVFPVQGAELPHTPSVFIGLPDAVLDCNNAALTCLVVGTHDVLLVNAPALEQLQNSTYGLCDHEMMNARVEQRFLNIRPL